MSWTYLVAPENSVTDSSRPSRVDPASWPTVKSSLMPEGSYCPGWDWDRSTPPPSGTMSLPLQVDIYRRSTPLLEDSPARTSALRELDVVLKASGAAFFSRSYGLLAHLDPLSLVWRTSQRSLLEEADGSFQVLPRSGMTVGGRLYQLPRLVPPTTGTGGGAWPTPMLPGNGGSNGKTKQKALIQNWPTPTVADDRTGNFTSSQQKEGSMHSVTLPQIAGKWFTPVKSDGKSGGSLMDWEEYSEDGRTTQARLRNQIHAWATPKASISGPDYNRENRPNSGAADLLTQAARLHPETSKDGKLSLPVSPKLNPCFVEMLLGCHIGMTELEPWAIPSTARARKRPSHTSSKATCEA